MRRIATTAAIFGFAFGLALAFIWRSAPAHADVSVTYLSANAKTDQVTFAFEPDGGLSMAVCGHVDPYGTSPTTPCALAIDVPSASTPALITFMNGGALNRYKTANGL